MLVETSIEYKVLDKITSTNAEMVEIKKISYQNRHMILFMIIAITFLIVFAGYYVFYYKDNGVAVA